jgi:hypothetical protein
MCSRSRYFHDLSTALAITSLNPGPVPAACWAAEVIRVDRPPNGPAIPDPDPSEQAEIFKAHQDCVYFFERDFLHRLLLEPLALKRHVARRGFFAVLLWNR